MGTISSDHRQTALRGDVLRAARAIATENGGPIDRAELLALGLSSKRIWNWTRDGILVPEFRNVYSFDASPLPQRGVVLGAIKSCPGQAVAGFESASSLADLSRERWRPVHLIVLEGNPRPQPGVILHRTTTLDAADIAEYQGVPATKPARTIMDRARDASDRTLDRLLDRCMELRLFDPYAFPRVIEARSTTREATRLRAALGRLDETCGRNRSELERRLIELIRASGLPRALNNRRRDSRGSLQIVSPWE